MAAACLSAVLLGPASSSCGGGKWREVKVPDPSCSVPTSERGPHVVQETGSC